MKKILILFLGIGLVQPAFAQKRKSQEETIEHKEEKSILEKTSFSGLKFRSLGPAQTSGRISDFAMHPDNPKIYYAAVSSGGVWKTENAGTTFTPIFDSEGSYSTGVVTIDPNNPSVVWVGTGENNNQRSVGYGDGIYKSEDGGKSWKNMGLKESEHIGSIIVHPDNSDILYVAAIGPLWSSGGDRGVYVSKDGGETWSPSLSIDEHTGVNDIVMDPRNPDILYATAFQRRRHVFTYIGGGPGSAIYKTTDGGETWQKSINGLPKSELGRIGMAISPANPEIIYAIVEAQEDGGVYRSTDRGAFWHKRGSYSTSGNYYQEIVCDPVNENKLYAMDTWMKVSLDGGKTFENVGEDAKHVDNHCMWIDENDTDHFLVGCDGGIYETWDAAKTWHFKANLPIIQFYKVSVDNSVPFYYIHGGTQDNFSMGGPSRSISNNGISNDEWFITRGGDGFESQADPENPNIVYAQSQYGVLYRYDRLSGEELGIQPKPRDGEAAYRWNWDAPLEVSVHRPGRIYFAANKVFRSDDRGHSWDVISEDLTQQINRNELKVMDRVWSVDAVRKNLSTSPFGTIVAFSESPLDEDLLYAGTDDGLIQVTEDGGNTWRKVMVPNAPEMSYVNEVLASHHEADVVYAALNHHKYGDFRPYIYKSSDRGMTWQSISDNLPERGSIYAIEEDHVDGDLLFVGTEFGVFFSNSNGSEWKQLKNGVPTIAVRDIAIQERENDLVLGTFGRGFYVLDDYSVLRNLKSEDLGAEHKLLSVRNAKSWEWAYPLGLAGKSFQGDSYYQGDNLGPVAMFTYYLKEEIETREDQRKEAEKELIREKQDVSYPSYEELTAEVNEEKPKIYFEVRDIEGNIVRKLSANPKKGVNRINWDLRSAPKDPVSLSSPSFYNPFSSPREGFQVTPGEYSVTMMAWQNGEMKRLDGPVSFRVDKIDHFSIPNENYEGLVAFKNKVTQLRASVQATDRILSDISNEMRHVREAISDTEIPEESLLIQVIAIEAGIREIRKKLSGDRLASRLDIDQPMSVSRMVGSILSESKYSSSPPTQTHQNLLVIAEGDYLEIIEAVNDLLTNKVHPLREAIKKAGAPYTPNALPESIRF